MSFNKGKTLVLAALLLTVIAVFYLAVNGFFTSNMQVEAYSLAGNPIPVKKIIYLDEKMFITNDNGKLQGCDLYNYELLWNITFKDAIKKFWKIEDKAIVESLSGASMVDLVSHEILWNFTADGDNERVIDACSSFTIFESRTNKDEKGSTLFFINNEGEAEWNLPLYAESVLCGVISPDNEYISISTLEISDSIKSRVYLFNKNGDMIWAKNFDNEIISFVSFSGEDVGTLKENTLVYISPDGNIKKVIELAGNVMMASATKDGSIVICRKDSPESNIVKDVGRTYIDLYGGNKNKRLWSVELEKDCRHLKISDDGNLIVASTQNRVVIFTREGDYAGEYSTDFSIDRMVISPLGIPFIISHENGSVLVNDL